MRHVTEPLDQMSVNSSGTVSAHMSTAKLTSGQIDEMWVVADPDYPLGYVAAW
jgi:hypothetical protein